MEPAEYKVLHEQEETYWWYRGLRRLVLEQARAALAAPTAGTGTPASGPRTRGPSDAGGPHDPVPRARVLDAGCGAGGMLTLLSPLGSAFGLDASPLALGLAASRRAAPLCRGSVGALPFRSGAFRLIVSLDVLYHREVPSDLEALREFHRCLAPSGTLVLNLPAYESLRSVHDEAVHTARRYRREPLRALLREAGLQPVRMTYWNTLLFPGIALARLARRRLPSGHAGAAARARSDVVGLPRPVGRALEWILALERSWLRHRDFSYGLSLMAVARRPPSRP